MIRKPTPLAALALVLFSSAPMWAQSASIGGNFTSMTVQQVGTANGGGWSVPPDTTGVIGPNHWMQYNNGGTVILRKDGSTARAMGNEANFWNTIGGLSVSPSGDPRLIYNPLVGRYFAVAFTGEATNNSVLIARSDTADPTGTWKAVRVTNSTGLFADFPTLGMDRNGLYIGINNFTSTSFSRVDVYSVPMADLIASTPTLANMTRFTNTGTGFTTQGVNNFNLGQTSSAIGRLLSGNFTSSVAVTPVNGAGGTPATLGTTAFASVASFASPPTASQPNAGNTSTSATTLAAGDVRVGGAVYQVGNLVYLARGTSSGSQAAVRVTIINVSAATPTLVAEATIGGTAASNPSNPDPSFSLTYPTIAANANGDIVVGYTRMGFVSSGNSANRYPSAYASVGKLTGSTLTFGSQIEVFRGERDYVSFQGTGGANRWGDYSATMLDPTDPGIFWTTQEYASNTTQGTGTNTTNWATRAAEIIPTVTGEKRWASVASATTGGSGNQAWGITGTWNTAANWYGGAIPVSTDHVIFSRNGDGTSASNYTVTLPAGATSVNRLSVRQGFVTLSVGGGNTLSLTNPTQNTPSLSVAEYLGTANLTVSGGGILNSVTTSVAAGRNSDAATNGVSAQAFNASVGTLTVTGAGTTWANSGNVFVGGYIDGTPTLITGGQGTVAVDSGVAATIGGSTSLFNAPTGRNANRLTVGSAGSSATYATAALENIGGGTVVPIVTLANAASALTVNGSINSTFGGQITGAGTLTKSGTGAFTLTGNTNNYTGANTINNGTLNANNTTSGTSATGTGAVTASGTGTLAGSGFVGGAVTVNSGGTVRGGVNNGTTLDTLTVQNNVTVNPGGRFGADLANLSSGAGTYTRDKLVVDGAGRSLNFATSGGAFVIPLFNDANLTQGAAYTFTIASATNGATITENGAAPNFVFGTDYSLTSANFSSFNSVSLVVSGTNLNLTFTPVPEPATVFAVGVVGVGAAGWLRRRHRAKAA